MSKKNTIQSFLLATLFVMSSNNYANALNTDADSIGLGGDLAGVNNAFSVLKNPASIMTSKNGNIILPLSPTLSFNSDSLTIKQISDFKDIFAKKDVNSISEILSFLDKNNGKIALESNVYLPILGYSGTPFSIGNNKIGFGINIAGSVFVKSNFEVSKVLSSGFSSTFSTVNDIKSKVESSSTKISDISKNLKLPDLSKYTSGSFNIFDPAQLKTASEDFGSIQKNTIEPLITEGENTLAEFDKITKDIKGLLETFSSISKDKLLKGELIADGHAVIGVSGAMDVFKNNFVNVSAGLTLKAFVMPSIPLGDTLGKSVPETLVSNFAKTPISITADIEADKFKSIDDINTLLDNDVKAITDAGKELMTNTKDLNTKVSSILGKINQNELVAAVSESASLRSDFVNIQTIGTELTKKVDANFAKNITDKIQSSLKEDLKGVKLNINSVTDVSPVGFGADLGVQAILFNDLLLSLSLENPVVLWPSKSKKSVYGLDLENKDLSKLDIFSVLKLMEEGKAQDYNYNLSEPFAMRFGGAYNLAKITPYLNEGKLVADVEQVFNGRPLAFHLGFEKNWNFGLAGVSLRLGTQLGGLANTYSVGLGTNIGAFNISAGYSASNPIDPTNSKSISGGLSTSVRF
ncbi:MAG: hypothetical protein AABZ74_04365 [Cyanobacteriota bacterium]